MRSSAIQIKSLSEPYALPNSGLKQQLTQNQPITLEQIKIELTSGSWQQLPSEEQDKSFKALWLHNNKDHEAILPYLLEQRLSRQPASRLNIQEQKFLANLIKPNQDWPLDSFALLGEKQEIPLAICDLLLTKSQPKLMSCQKAIDIILQNHADGKQRLSEVLVKKITHAEFTQPRLYSTRPMDGKNCTYFKLAERYFKIAEWFLQNNYAHKLDIGGANALAEHYDPTIVAKAKAILTDYNAKQKPATTTSDLEHFAHISKEEQKKAVLASCQRLYELAGVEAGGRDIAFYHLRLLRRAWTLDKSIFEFIWFCCFSHFRLII